MNRKLTNFLFDHEMSETRNSVELEKKSLGIRSAFRDSNNQTSLDQKASIDNIKATMTESKHKKTQDLNMTDIQLQSYRKLEATKLYEIDDEE